MKLPPVQPPATPGPDDARALRQETRLREASEGFEALFMTQVLKSARAASLGTSLFDSAGTRTTQSMLDSRLMEQSAGRAGLGLSDAIYRQFAGHLGKTGD